MITFTIGVALGLGLPVFGRWVGWIAGGRRTDTRKLLERYRNDPSLVPPRNRFDESIAHWAELDGVRHPQPWTPL